MIDHVQLVVADIEASRKFYAGIMSVLGIPPGPSAADYFNYDELWVSTKESHAAQGELTGRVHLAFATRDRAVVDAFHEAGLAAGGRDGGAPGERTKYHPGYYAAFVLDPDGNNLEVVYHGEARYSAPSVVITY